MLNNKFEVEMEMESNIEMPEITYVFKWFYCPTQECHNLHVLFCLCYYFDVFEMLYLPYFDVDDINWEGLCNERYNYENQAFHSSSFGEGEVPAGEGLPVQVVHTHPTDQGLSR